MQKTIRSLTGKAKGLLIKHRLLLIVCVIYAVLAVYYMHPVMSMCRTSVISQGDATAGLVARNELVNNNPLWGFTDKLSFPVGDNLYHPVNWSAPAFYGTYWVFSKVGGAVCGLNLLNFAGYILTASTMFLFVQWLIRNRWIAFMAGYASSFSPYFQSKVGGHPSYGYSALLITLLWLSLLVWRRKEKKYVVLLGVNVAFLAYWDPYFVLLGGVLIAGMFAGLLTSNLLSRKRDLSISIIKRYLLAVVLAFVLISPLIFVRLNYASQISSVVSDGRDDIRFDAYAYSNRPIEYLLPAESHPVLNKIFGPGYQKINRHYSNPSEYTVGISMAVIVVLLSFLIVICWEYLTKGKVWQRIRLNALPQPLDDLLTGLVITAGLAFFMALPPRYGPLYSLSYLLTEFVTMWRVFSRLYIVINISLIVMCAIALFYFSKSIAKRQFKIAAYILLAILLFFEYQAYYPGRRYWSYATSVPSIYYRLSERRDISSIAEYPLDDRDLLGLRNNYVTFQRIHDKALFNSIVTSTDSEELRFGLVDLSDPQTLPALRALGIDGIMLHGSKASEDIQGLELLDQQVTAIAPISKLEPIYLYKVLEGPKVGYVTLPNFSDVEIEYDNLSSKSAYKIKQRLRLDLRMLSESSAPATLCANIQNSSSNPIEATFVDGTSKQILLVSGANLIKSTSRHVEVKDIKGSYQDLRVTHFGC